MIKSKITVPDKRLSHQGEMLLNTQEAASQGTIGFNSPTDGDRLSFISLPQLSVRELEDEGYIGFEGREATVAELTFSNLLESVGQLARILIYYEEINPLTFKLPERPRLLWVQTKNLLAEVPVLEIDDTLTLKYELTITKKPVTYYCFYAVYLNNEGRPALQNGTAIISFAIKQPFYGVNLMNNIFEMPEVTAAGLEDSATIQEIDQKTITLSWYNLTQFKTEIEWSAVFGGLPFRDSYNHYYNLSYKHIVNFDYAIVYEFISSNGWKPKFGIPRNIDWFSELPAIPDPNGTWKPVARTKENTITLTLPSQSTVGYWVGFKLRS